MVSRGEHLRRCALVAMAMLVAACGSESTEQVAGPTPTPATKTPGPRGAPWQRTEERADCGNFNITRNPYFGDLHVHTTNSIDAILFNTLNTPRDAYRFANGEPIGLAPYDAEGNPVHTIQLGRRLDFTAVTDHAEGFGAQSVCFLPGLPGYDSTLCQLLRETSVSADPNLVTQAFLSFIVPVITSTVPILPQRVCGRAPAYADCASRQSLFWLETQAAAEEFYDRSAACTFTSFVGYEWTGTPDAANLHRNVIFRNAVVPALPVTYIEQQKPQNLWAELKVRCQDTLAGCDWLAIPHNSNISGPEGRMFLPENADGNPLTTADAATRAAMEPLVEIYQHKGSSECRPGVDSVDEQCGFELVQINVLQGTRDPNQTFGRLAFVRNALKEGLVQEQLLGANPFRLGIIASTDTHNGSPGYTREDNWFGHSGVNDDTPENGQLRLTGKGRGDESPAGLAVVWAEENSRDALFAAMRRRETYGTSGPRHLVRFFAGTYAADVCQEPQFAAAGYRHGVPMGAEIGPIAGNASPVFAVLAMKDPGDPDLAGAPLQRIQIVKGWVDETGTAQEKVFDVAGDPNNGAGVDLSTCTPTGTGFDTLCTTWNDPEFKPQQRAFYYARVLENPTCRWSTYVCNRSASEFDCSNPASVPANFTLCCDPTIAKTIQERSWSSPIWYRPEGLAGVEADITYGKRAGTDQLKLTAKLGAGVAHDLATQDLRVIVSDDDDILDVTIPAGTMQEGKVANFAGLELAVFEQEANGPATLVLQTAPSDLARADRVDHMVEVKIHIGDTFVVSQSRLWTFDGKKLATT
jgi:hypothetical protein